MSLTKKDIDKSRYEKVASSRSKHTPKEVYKANHFIRQRIKLKGLRSNLEGKIKHMFPNSNLLKETLCDKEFQHGSSMQET